MLVLGRVNWNEYQQLLPWWWPRIFVRNRMILTAATRNLIHVHLTNFFFVGETKQLAMNWHYGKLIYSKKDTALTFSKGQHLNLFGGS